MNHSPLAAEKLDSASPLARLMQVVSEVLLDKEEVVELAVATLVAGGHLLLEDVPGVGKTTLAKALAAALGTEFKRIQFTSDMLPSDIIGVTVFDSANVRFHFNKGPVFTQVLLADEINRTPPRTQSALLEAMSELQVTVDNLTHPMPRPFFVIATQNPLELHGTYPLPESQLDRFMMRLSMGYPSPRVEQQVISQERDEARLGNVPEVASPQDVISWQAALEQVAVKPQLIEYIQKIIGSTRSSEEVVLGASPRAGIQLFRAARALAMVRGRDYVVPDDIRYLAPNVLAHRLWLKGERFSMGQTNRALGVMARLVDSIPLP